MCDQCLQRVSERHISALMHATNILYVNVYHVYNVYIVDAQSLTSAYNVISEQQLIFRARRCLFHRAACTS